MASAPRGAPYRLKKPDAADAALCDKNAGDSEVVVGGMDEEALPSRL
jgi:hypothetical protein